MVHTRAVVLDLNGSNPFRSVADSGPPAGTAPGCSLSIGSGQYDLGKEQLLRGTSVQPAYARSAWKRPGDAGYRLLVLASGSGRGWTPGEEDTFKLMLWRGQVLWGR